MNQPFSPEKLDYRALLKWELEVRQRKNPAFSLRAYARFLGVSAPYLSQVMARKRTLSEDMALSFAKKLRWPLKRRKLLLSLVRYQRTRSEEHREQLLQQADSLAELNFLELQREQFELVAGWEHFALVELAGLPGFSANPNWVAKRLGIPRKQADSALQRLLKTGLLREDGGRITKSQPFYRIQDTPFEAIRRFHRDHLRMATHAIENQKFSDRDVSGATLSFDRAKLPEMRQLIREFQEKLDSFCANSGAPDSVYHLAVQFYRLDKDTL